MNSQIGGPHTSEFIQKILIEISVDTFSESTMQKAQEQKNLRHVLHLQVQLQSALGSSSIEV